VVDGLTSFLAVVDHVPTPLRTKLAPDLRCHEHEVTEAFLCLLAADLLLSPGELRDLELGDDEDVRRSNRVDVAEGEALVILVDLVASDLSSSHLTKDRVLC